MQERSSVLVASSNAGFRKRILMRLHDQLPAGASTNEEAAGGADALAWLEVRRCKFMLLDMRLADLDAIEILPMMRAQDPSMEVLMLDSEADLPVCPGQSSGNPALRRICEIFEHELAEASLELPAPEPEMEIPPTPFRPLAVATPLPAMLGDSEAMAKVYRNVRLVARRTTTVLLTGESGTGKELVARAIHEISPRAGGPFITVNCAAIPESLMESELFGYSRGAFTGAVQSKLGRVHAAHGGTLFLDEIGELALNLQAKLLRFLQEGEVQRLGSPDLIRIETRVVAATNCNLLQRVKDGTFRRDLYYRLSVFPVELPPLKDRTGDVIELARHFLSFFCRAGGQSPKQFSTAAVRALEAHDWPGNVRELQHAIERATILADDEPTILPEHLSLAS
jgi:DNA-binding NtrC family response regulator